MPDRPPVDHLAEAERILATVEARFGAPPPRPPLRLVPAPEPHDDTTPDS
jgi:hypothetical protein